MLCAAIDVLWTHTGQMNKESSRDGIKNNLEDYESSFDELLLKDDSININQQDLKVLAVEMYKTFYKLSPEFMWDLVEEINTKYQTRSSCNIDINEDEKIECTKKSSYLFQKTNKTSFGLQLFKGLKTKI